VARRIRWLNANGLRCPAARCAARQYRTAARTDAVTGLHSSPWWNQICEQALERAIGTGSVLGVLILDVDRFKEVNDTYGHVAGGQVLSRVAQTIRTEIRDYDSPGRRGGDEFAIVVR
jgi:diguanylate cyclase (GGDEF)-like protein